MPKSLSMTLILLLTLLVSYSPPTIAYQQIVDNRELVEKYQNIRNNDILSPTEKYQSYQRLSFNVDETRYPELAAAIYLELLGISSKVNNINNFNQWQQQLDDLPLSSANTRVINFLINLYQMQLSRNQGQYIVAIAQGEKLNRNISSYALVSKARFNGKELQLNERDYAFLLNALGVSYFRISDYQFAQQRFIQAMNIFKKHRYQNGMLLTYRYLAMLSNAQHNSTEAISFIEQSITIAQQLSDEENIIIGLADLGKYYAESSKFDNALASYRKVLTHQNIDLYPKIKIKTLLNKAKALQLVSEYEKSEQVIQEALLISTRINDQIGLSSAKVALANLLTSQQKFNQALSFYLEAINHFKALKLRRRELGVLKKISDLYSQQHDFINALSYYKKYNQQNVELLKLAQKSSIFTIHEKFEQQRQKEQIEKLQNENKLNKISIQNTKNQQQYLLYISISTIIILLLLINRIYQRKHALRLKEHNQELKENKKQLLLLSHAFSNTTDGVWITNSHFEIEAVNNAYVLQCHKTRIEVIGKQIQFAQVKGQTQAFTKRILSQAKLEGTWHGELYEQRSDNEIFPVELDIEAIKNEQNEIIHYLGVFRDISERKKSQQQLSQLATHDDLTGLVNRTLLEQLIQQSCLNSKHSQKTPTLLLLNVNGFTKINDSLGHSVGDQVIKEIAHRLKTRLYAKDVIARMDGAKFCILAELNDSKHSVIKVAQKILSIFEQAFTLNDSPFSFTASLGITMYPNDSDNAQDLMRKAAIAMLDVKKGDRHHYRFFEPNMNTDITKQLEREQRLLNAINNQEFIFYYQPLVNTKTGNICGAEALIRWQTTNGEIIPPDEFIPLAEQAGFIDKIDRITISTVFKQVASWQRTGHLFGTVAINISGKMFSQPQDLLTLLQAKISQYSINASLIKIEITESMLLDNIEQAIETMSQIKSLGFQLALDDFGTGFSSLNYLKKFPIDILKIDRSFISDMHQNDVDRSIVKSIVSLAHTLNLKVVGEGVEIKEHVDELQQMNCQEYQGYYYSKPISNTEFEQLL